ncbi:unnamed protein product, partial [Prorocentrum cordatum]
MTVCPELRPERPRPPPIFDLRLGGAEAAHCAYTGNFGVASASRPAVTDAIGQLVEGFGASGLLPHENSAGAEAEALGAEVPRSRWRARVTQKRLWLSAGPCSSDRKRGSRRCGLATGPVSTGNRGFPPLSEAAPTAFGEGTSPPIHACGDRAPHPWIASVCFRAPDLSGPPRRRRLAGQAAEALVCHCAFAGLLARWALGALRAVRACSRKSCAGARRLVARCPRAAGDAPPVAARPGERLGSPPTRPPQPNPTRRP